MSPIPPPERPRRNVALIISISVNLVLAGVIAMAVARFAYHGPIFHGHHGAGWSIGGPRSGPGGIERQQVRQLMSPWVLVRAAPDKADALRALAKAHRPEIDNLRDAAATARHEVVRLYTADELDRPAFEKALAHMQATNAALEIAVLKATAETSVILTAEQRRAVIAPQPPRGPRGEDGGKHGRRGPAFDAPPGPDR
jgi:Spy/CpxP family protein refolding chaperone